MWVSLSASLQHFFKIVFKLVLANTEDNNCVAFDVFIQKCLYKKRVFCLKNNEMPKKIIS